MSVVNSHLCAGGSAVLTRHSLASPALWSRARETGVTTLPTVPAQLKLLHRLNFSADKFCPSLTSITQAGGKVDKDVLAHFAAMMACPKWQVFRHVRPDRSLAAHGMPGHYLGDRRSGRRGRAAGRRAFEIIGEDGQLTAPPGVTGTIHYRGANVMMGYAESAAELGLDDQNCGALDTGDIGYIGENGLLYVSGRSKRFAKIGGIRCNLDELERAAEQISSPAAVLPMGDSVVIFWTSGALDNPRRAGAELARAVGVPVDAVSGRLVDTIPLLESGKTNYTALKEFAS